MKALILAGGFGTRLREVAKDVPKPMVSIVGKPFLEHQLRALRDQGIEEVVLAVHHMANKVKSYFGDGRHLKMNITYSQEETPLGTGGAIKHAERHLDKERFLVLNGDSFSRVDIDDFLKFHLAGGENALGSMTVTPITDSSHYETVSVQDSTITAIHRREDNKPGTPGLINSGVYIFEPAILERIERGKNVSLEREVFPRLVDNRALRAYQYSGYFMDIGRPETYRQFKADMLSTMLMNGGMNVRDALQRMREIGSDLVLITDEERKLRGTLTRPIIETAICTKGTNLTDRVEDVMVRDPVTIVEGESPEKVSSLFMQGIHRLPVLDNDGRVVDLAFGSENRGLENFLVVRGKAPLRVSFAGGGTDLPYFFDEFGGAVISATIDRYCHATLVRRADNLVVINPGEGEEVFSLKDKTEYDGKADLVKAVVKLTHPSSGFDLYTQNDVPPGRGLGSSASFSVLLASLIGRMQDASWDDNRIAEMAYRAEREELQISGGWQDQYAAVTGGFNFMEFSKERNVIYPLRLKPEVVDELSEHLLLYYIGEGHSSGKIHDSQRKDYKANEQEAIKNLRGLKDITTKIKDCLLAGDLEGMGKMLHDSWLYKRSLGGGITNGRIDELYDLGMKNGAIGGKLLGAGGGGYMLYFVPPTKREGLMRVLRKCGEEITNFNFEFGGTKVWSPRTYGA